MKNFIQRDEREVRDFSKKDLSKNEAAYGTHRLYPDSIPVRDKLASSKGVEPNEIILTAGCDHAIKMVFDRFVSKRDWVIYPYPTFGMVDVYAGIREARVKRIDYNLFREIDVKDSLRRKHKVLYLANPDNPTGTYFGKDGLKNILDRAKELDIIVILDLTYVFYVSSLYEGIDGYEKALMETYGNLIIVNSFSKSHALAGQRIGYILSQYRNIEKLKQIAPLHPLTDLGIKNLDKAITDETMVLEKNRTHVWTWHRIMKSTFPEYYEKTYTNFVLIFVFDVYKRAECISRCEAAGIKIREFNHPDCLDSALRISIGPDLVMRKVLKILKGVLK